MLLESTAGLLQNWGSEQNLIRICRKQILRPVASLPQIPVKHSDTAVLFLAPSQLTLQGSMLMESHADVSLPFVGAYSRLATEVGIIAAPCKVLLGFRHFCGKPAVNSCETQ